MCGVADIRAGDLWFADQDPVDSILSFSVLIVEEAPAALPGHSTEKAWICVINGPWCAKHKITGTGRLPEKYITTNLVLLSRIL